MPSTKTSHFLFFPIPAWGHIRPFCVLAPRLVREQKNVVVTFMVGPHVLEKARAEISRQFSDESSDSVDALKRIRILSPPGLSPESSPDMFEMMKALAIAYPPAYQTLYDAKPITCSVTGTTFDAIPAPCAAVLDFFALHQLRATRAISGHSVPIITVVTGGAGAILRLFGPEAMGGMGDIGARIDAETARTGLSDEEIGSKIYNHTEGKLVQIPGLPAMYDYEFFPQMKPTDHSTHTLIRSGYASFREGDATIINNSYAYETVSLDAMKQWFSDMQKELHVLGPLLPPGFGTETQNGEAGSSADFETFLGEMLVQHGKGSVFFISFGSIFYPPASEYVDELIEALIEKKVPFIFSHASPYAKISEEMIEKVKSSGIGKLTTWSPQQFILNHPATGWFVSHGGFNGVTESLGSGVPLICWPISADQPAAAAHLTKNLNVAFELFQVRTGGDGVKPLARNGVAAEGTREAVGVEIRQTIDLSRSEKGQEMRNNAEQLKVKFARTWEEEDGMAKQEIRKFLHKYSV